MQTNLNFKVQDIYLPVRQLCSRNKVCPDIARYIMMFVKDDYMLSINTGKIVEKIRKKITTFHVGDLIYKNMDLHRIKQIVEKYHNGSLMFSHYCCGGKGIMYKSIYENDQLVFAI